MQTMCLHSFTVGYPKKTSQSHSKSTSIKFNHMCIPSPIILNHSSTSFNHTTLCIRWVGPQVISPYSCQVLGMIIVALRHGIACELIDFMIYYRKKKHAGTNMFLFQKNGSSYIIIYTYVIIHNIPISFQFIYSNC